MKKNPRVGCKGYQATHVLPTSFRDLSDGRVRLIQKQYATGFYTQSELAERHKVSTALVSKICRVAGDNLDAAMKNIRSRMKARSAG